MKLARLFLLIDYVKISIKPNGRAKRIVIIITENINETISDPELNDIEYMLMHEAVSSGKNVITRVLCIKL